MIKRNFISISKNGIIINTRVVFKKIICAIINIMLSIVFIQINIYTDKILRRTAIIISMPF